MLLLNGREIKRGEPVHCLFEDHQDVFIFSFQTSGSFNQKIKRFFFENGFGSSSTFAIHATPIVMSNRFIPEFLLLYIAIFFRIVALRNLVWKSSKIVVFGLFLQRNVSIEPHGKSQWITFVTKILIWLNMHFLFIFFQSTSNVLWTYFERTSKFSAL